MNTRQKMQMLRRVSKGDRFSYPKESLDLRSHLVFKLHFQNVSPYKSRQKKCPMTMQTGAAGEVFLAIQEAFTSAQGITLDHAQVKTNVKVRIFFDELHGVIGRDPIYEEGGGSNDTVFMSFDNARVDFRPNSEIIGRDYQYFRRFCNCLFHVGPSDSVISSQHKPTHGGE